MFSLRFHMLFQINFLHIFPVSIERLHDGFRRICQKGFMAGKGGRGYPFLKAGKEAAAPMAAV